MHEGAAATVRGLKGIPAAAEEAAVARAVILAEMTGARLHLAPVSTAGSVELVRRAKERGVPVTAGTTPHHLTAVDEDVEAHDARWKVDPPLRTEADREALRDAVRDGVVDVIFTDHAPFAREEWERSSTRPSASAVWKPACALLHELVLPGRLLAAPIERMSACAGPSTRPARRLLARAPADVTVIDMQAARTVDPESGRSSAQHALAGRRLTGWAWAVLVGGRLVMHEGRVLDA